MDQIFESHFGGNQSSSNGGEVEGYCPKCRADTQHIILESYGDEIRLVQCAVCGDTHAFKPPRGGDDDNPETVAAAKRRGLKKPDWLDAMNLFEHTKFAQEATGLENNGSEGDALGFGFRFVSGFGIVLEIVHDAVLKARVRMICVSSGNARSG